MKKHLNNKGYLLIEIILASAIATGVAFFLTELTIKLKNKNDDLLVKTLVYTDQAIIYNAIAKDIYSSDDEITCDYINSKLEITGNKFTYDGFTNILSEYATFGDIDCTDEPALNITIPIAVKQLQQEDFDVVIQRNYDLTTGESNVEGTVSSFKLEDTSAWKIYEFDFKNPMTWGEFLVSAYNPPDLFDDEDGNSYYRTFWLGEDGYIHYYSWGYIVSDTDTLAAPGKNDLIDSSITYSALP